MLTTMLTFALAAIPQNTWTVDANNGPGTDFTDLPPAVAAAQSGDTIRMRAGSYTGTTITGKSLTISGDGAVVIDGWPDAPGLYVIGQPSGGVTRLSGLDLFGAPAVACDSGGLVLIDSAVVGRRSFGSTSGLGVIDTRVHAERCRFEGHSPTSVPISLHFLGGYGATIGTGSRLYANDCEFRGADVGYQPSAYSVGGTGILTYSDCWLTRCHIRGGTGYTGSSPGVYCMSGAVRIAGDNSWYSTISGGNGANAIQCANGTVFVHQPVPIAGATAGNVILDPRAMPRLAVTGSSTPSGALDAMQPISIDYDGVIPNAPYFFVVGFAPDFSDAFAPLLLGPMLIDLSTASLQLGTLDATASFSGSLVPANVLGPLAALPLHAQAGTFDFNTGEFRVSNGTITRFE